MSNFYGPKELRFMTNNGEVQLTFPSTSPGRLGSKPYEFNNFASSDTIAHGYRVANVSRVYSQIDKMLDVPYKTKQIQVYIAEQTGRSQPMFIPYIGLRAMDHLEDAVTSVVRSIELNIAGAEVPVVRLLPVDGSGYIAAGRNMRADAVAFFSMKVRPMEPPSVQRARMDGESDDEMRERLMKALQLTAAPKVKSEDELFLERLQAKMRARYGT